MFAIEARSTDSLLSERKRLIYDVEAIERGEARYSQAAYDRLLSRLAVVDRELERRERETVTKKVTSPH